MVYERDHEGHASSTSILWDHLSFHEISFPWLIKAPSELVNKNISSP